MGTDEVEVLVRTEDEQRYFSGDEWADELASYVADMGEELCDGDIGSFSIEMGDFTYEFEGKEDVKEYIEAFEEMDDELTEVYRELNDVKREKASLDKENTQLKQRVRKLRKTKDKLMDKVEKFEEGSLREATVEEIVEDEEAIWMTPAGSSYPIKQAVPSQLYDRLDEGDVLEVTNDHKYNVVGINTKYDEVGSEFSVESEDLGEISFDDIGGYDEQLEELTDGIVLQHEFPQFYDGEMLDATDGIILHGPPGTGKTLSVKALANEYDMNLFLVNGPEIMSKWVGKSEENIRRVSRAAKESAPSIVMFDELDSIAHHRGAGSSSNVGERVVSQLLTEMEGMEEYDNVYWVATTNRLDLIDDALKRSGRFGDHIEFDRPAEEATREIAQVYMPDDVVDMVTEKILADESYQAVNSGAMIRDVKNTAVKEYLKDIREQDDRPDWVEGDVGMEDMSRIPDEFFRDAVDEVYESLRAQGADDPDGKMFQ